MQPLALGAAALAFGCPRKMGQKRRKSTCLPQFSNTRRIRRSRSRSSVKPRATARNSPCFPSPRSGPGKTPKTNGSRRPSGTASRSSARASPNTSSTSIKKGSHVLIEGSLISSIYERPNGKGKKADDHEDHLVVDSRRRRAQARPRRTGTGSDYVPFHGFGGSSRNVGVRFPTEACAHWAPAICRGLFLCWPQLRPNRTNLPHHSPLRSSISSTARVSAFPTARAEGFGPRPKTIRARFPKTPGVVPLPA